MLGIMEEPPALLSLPAVENESSSEDKSLKLKKQLNNRKLTDFFKTPPKAAIQKPVDLLGYFCPKNFSEENHKLKTGQTDSSKITKCNGRKETEKKEGTDRKKKSSKLQTGDEEKTKIPRSPDNRAPLEAASKSAVPCNKGKGGGGKLKGKRKKIASPGSSADDFESPPPSRRPKRPKVDGKKPNTGKKVFSLSDSDREDCNVEAKYDTATWKEEERVRDEPEEPERVEEECNRGEKNTSPSLDRNVADDTVDEAKDVADDDQNPLEINKGGKDEKSNMEVISYEEFLNSGMDVAEEDGKDLEEENGGNEKTASDAEIIYGSGEEDSVVMISPGGGTHSVESETIGEESTLEESENDIFDGDVKPLVDGSIEKLPAIDSSKKSGHDHMIGVVKTDQQLDDSSTVITPTKPTPEPLYQSPKLVVAAMVHTSPGVPTGGKVTADEAKTPQSVGRTSNVALDDADNSISLIQVVNAPIKPVYSIFLKRGKGTKCTEEQNDRSIDDDQGPPRKGKHKGIAMDGKNAGDEQGGKGEGVKKRGRGRPRKTDNREKDCKPPCSDDNGAVAVSEKKESGKKAKRGRPRKTNEDKKGTRRRDTPDRSKVISEGEKNHCGTRTLRPRRSKARRMVIVDDDDDETEEEEEEEGDEIVNETGNEIAENSVQLDKSEIVRTAKSRQLSKRNRVSKYPVKTNTQRAREIVKRAKLQRNPHQGTGQTAQGQPNKRTLRVRLDPLGLSDKVVTVKYVGVETQGQKEVKGQRSRKEETDSSKKTATSIKNHKENKPPVKLAPMFTKEGLKSLAKKQQETEHVVEVLTLSSDDECTNDSVATASPFTTVAVSKKWQAKAKMQDEPYSPPFPSISHVTQKDESGDLRSFWNLPDVDHSKLKISRIVLGNTPPPAIDWNASLDKFTCSHKADLRIPNVKFGKHPELSCESQKAALEEISKHNPKFPVKRIFKRYLAKRKGETVEEKKAKDGSHTTTSKTQLGKGSRKRKTESEDDPTQRKVRRRSLRGQSVKDQKQGAADEDRENINSEGKPKEKLPPTDLLWSDKYQPTSSEEVLGNAVSVKKLGGWLSDWKIKIQRIKKKEAKAQRGCKAAESREDSESDFEPSDGGCSGSEDEGDGICNTFLITGPHGVGKTSMVYACAKEMGFKVIEVNASSKRVGKQILDDLGEATQSHQLTGQAGLKSADLARFFKLKTPPALVKKPVKKAKPKIHKAFAAFVKAGQKSSENVNSKPSKKTTPRKTAVKKDSPKKSPKNLTPKKGRPSPKNLTPKKGRPSTKNLTPKKGRPSPKTKSAKSPGNGKKGSQAMKPSVPEKVKPAVSGATLILFDEVDLVFEEDKGFLSAISTFMASTKRPIILTTSDNHFGDCLEGKIEHVVLRKPDTSRLATSMQLVCLAENVLTDHQDVKNLVSYYGNDIRRSLHSLQAWVNTGAMLSPWQQTGDISPSRRVCKLSLKRLKGTSDYTCLLKKISPDDERKNAKERPENPSLPKLNKNSLLSLLGCGTFHSVDAIFQNTKQAPCGSITSYNSIRKLLRYGKDLIRNLERNTLQTFCLYSPPNRTRPESLQTVDCPKKLDDEKPQRVTDSKELDLKLVEKLSHYTDNLCTLDVLENTAGWNNGNVDKEEGHWWGVDVYAGLDNVSDDRMTQWSRREFNEDLCSVLEWENFSLCKRNLEQIKNSHEDLNSSTPEAKLGKDQSSDSLLKSDCRQSREISGLYGIVARKLPRVIRCNHHNVSLDYLPTMRSICRSEQLREAAHLKRRFLHYFDAISLPLKVTDQVQLASVAEHFRRKEMKSEAGDVDNIDMEAGISEGRR